MTAAAVCSSCRGPLGPGARFGECIRCWAQARTTAHDRTAQERAKVRAIALDQQKRQGQ